MAVDGLATKVQVQDTIEGRTCHVRALGAVPSGRVCFRLKPTECEEGEADRYPIWSSKVLDT